MELLTVVSRLVGVPEGDKYTIDISLYWLNFTIDISLYWLNFRYHYQILDLFRLHVRFKYKLSS